MTIEPYSERVRQLFADPQHAGSIDAAAAATVDEQGVRIALFADAEEGRVGRLRFQAWGCPHFIAAAEALCAACEGRPIGELEAFSANAVMQSLAVPVEKTGRILVIEDAVRSLGARLRDASESRPQKT